MKPYRFSLFAAALIAAFGLSLAGGDDRINSSRNGDAAKETQFVALQKSKAKSDEKKADTKKPRKFRGRLPAYWGRIGLSDSQRKKIYGIQISYRERIEMLEKQLQDLREKQAAEMDAVLKPDQKKKLDDLLEAARKKRAARSKKRSRKSRTTDKKAE